MNSKLISVQEYFDFFSFKRQGTGSGIQQERETGEYFFLLQTFLPKSFFNIEVNEAIRMFNPILAHQLEYLPDEIYIKFELFGIGSINDVEAFIFKPWILIDEHPLVIQHLEDFILFIPSTLFYNLLERLIFLDKLAISNFEHTRVLQDVPLNTFDRFGLHKQDVPQIISGSIFQIERVSDINENEILSFYSENWQTIENNIKNKYLRKSTNTWYRIIITTSSKSWFSKPKEVKKTIGFLRVYNSNSAFTGGASIEYIIAKNYRNRKIASESVKLIIEHIKKYSHCISLGAQVDDNNIYSKKLLIGLGFNESKSHPMIQDNYSLSLFDPLIKMKEKDNNGELIYNIIPRYVSKFERYL